MPNILGLSICTGHDSGAAIMKDKKLITAIEEEKLNRVKHYSGFPEKAIRHCLQAAQLTNKDIDYIGIPFHPTIHFLKRIKFAIHFNGMQSLLRRTRFIRALSNLAFAERDRLKRLFPNAKIFFIEHHLAHAASAYFASPFPESAILTMDGRGEWPTLLLATGENGKIKKIKELFYPASLGMFYTAFTHYLGFESNDEYKVMGLSSYGSLQYIDFFRKAIKFCKKKIILVDFELFQHPGYSPVDWGKNYYSKKVVSLLGPARNPKEPIESRHMDIAASLQQRFNELGLEITEYLHTLTKKEYLCMAGGVALNGVMNHKIKTSGLFKDVFIQPAAGDGGLSIGTALYIQKIILNQNYHFLFEHAYWGPEYNESDIEKELKIANIEYVKLNEPACVAAYLLKEGYIIGWFQGKTEIGPRALGNRSILADPRKAENKDIVNARIKFREEFRPFAPSILEEFVDGYYIDCRGSAAAYMLLVAPVKEGKEKIVPAVTHVDRTARVQVVNKMFNPLYYSLIRHFYNLTGVPVVLNTSFNVKGEPIVNSPVDAMKCFFTTGLDFLIMDKYMLFKKAPSEKIMNLIGARNA